MADINTAALNSARTAYIKKCVELNHLVIVKDYIDKKDNLSINTESGVHDIRFYNGNLQYKDVNGSWITISTGGGSGGSGVGGAITTNDMDSTVFVSDADVSNLFKI